MREGVSLLRANGHPNGQYYPLAYMWNEVGFVRRRTYDIMRMTATLTMVATQGTSESFKRVLEDMDDG